MMAPASRRGFLCSVATLPLVGGGVMASGSISSDPISPHADHALIAACAELVKLKDWVNHPDFPDTDEAIDAATDRDSELCDLIFRTPARTHLGLMWKARLTAREHSVDRFITWDGVTPLPRADSDRLLISLVNDVMHGPATA